MALKRVSCIAALIVGWNLVEAEAGIHASAAPWIKAHAVALIGSDSGLDVLPSQVDGVTLPVDVLLTLWIETGSELPRCRDAPPKHRLNVHSTTL